MIYYTPLKPMQIIANLINQLEYKLIGVKGLYFGISSVSFSLSL